MRNKARQKIKYRTLRKWNEKEREDLSNEQQLREKRNKERRLPTKQRSHEMRNKERREH